MDELRKMEKEQELVEWLKGSTDVVSLIQEDNTEFVELIRSKAKDKGYTVYGDVRATPYSLEFFMYDKNEVRIRCSMSFGSRSKKFHCYCHIYKLTKTEHDERVKERRLKRQQRKKEKVMKLEPEKEEPMPKEFPDVNEHIADKTSTPFAQALKAAVKIHNAIGLSYEMQS